MNTQIGTLKTKTDLPQVIRTNENVIENKVSNQSTISTRSSSPVLAPSRNQPHSIFEDFEQSFNRLFTSSLSFKEQRVDDIIHLSQMITPKRVHGDKRITCYDFNTNLINHSSSTKIIIPLVQLPLPIFKVETKDSLLGKKRLKMIPKEEKRKEQNAIETEEKEKEKEKEILMSEIEKDIDKEKGMIKEIDYQPSVVQTNQSNVYNVNITNVNINYNNSPRNKNIIKDIKNILLEKGLKYDSTHQKNSKDLKFSIGDYGYLIRQDQESEKFLCFVRTFNHSNRDKDVVHTIESDIIRELKTLKEDLRKTIGK